MAGQLLWLLPLLLLACGGGEDGAPRDRSLSRQPVALVLDADGRPDPSVLAAEQVLHRGNGSEPQTLDPHLAEDVPSANILGAVRTRPRPRRFPIFCYRSRRRMPCWLAPNRRRRWA